jgi:hypothetical protein
MRRNMVQKKLFFKIFLPWQDDKEEEWLEEMASMGWHLSRMKGVGTYEFDAGKPQSYVYRLDFPSLDKKDRNEYLTLFSDAGWEHIGELSGWQYFRKLQQEGESNEIFTDTSSKIAKYKRAMTLQVSMLAVYLTLWIVFSRKTGYWFDAVVPGIFVLLLLFFAIGYFKMAQRIKELEKAGLQVEKDNIT